MPVKNPLIIALDTQSSLKALNWVQSLKVTGVGFKIGFELFCAGGPKIVEKIVGHDVHVFLDLKFHDIPHTVAKASEVATKLGVWMFNVHASGGLAMMQKAKEAAQNTADKIGTRPPLVMGVTVLTSLASLDELNSTSSIEDQSYHLSSLAKQANLDGVVCSGHEVSSIKKKCGKDFVLVTPGIRPDSSSSDDQKRTMTPNDAIQAGSHFLVMGRPILNSKNPLKTIDAILGSLRFKKNSF